MDTSIDSLVSSLFYLLLLPFAVLSCCSGSIIIIVASRFAGGRASPRSSYSVERLLRHSSAGSYRARRELDKGSRFFEIRKDFVDRGTDHDDRQ
jgi:hypothetical protein